MIELVVYYLGVMMPDMPDIKLIQSLSDHGPRFAGPDLLDYAMIFEIIGGGIDGERIRIDSVYNVCFGTLEVRAGLFGVYQRWSNKLDGCKQHQREEDGDWGLRALVWNLLALVDQEDSGG